jgi:hypothetical protein
MSRHYHNKRKFRKSDTTLLTLRLAARHRYPVKLCLVCPIATIRQLAHGLHVHKFDKARLDRGQFRKFFREHENRSDYRAEMFVIAQHASGFCCRLLGSFFNLLNQLFGTGGLFQHVQTRIIIRSRAQFLRNAFKQLQHFRIFLFSQ